MLALIGMVIVVVSPSATAEAHDAEPDPQAGSGSQWLIVDCLLPGKIRRLGKRQTYVTRRLPKKLSASECEVRGGEYTSYDRADLRTSLSVWLEQAKEGDPTAQTYVGEIFEKGLGVPPDYDAAATWYRRAAEQNFPRAQMNLGHLYERGLGVEKDPIRALSWFRRAVGLPGAMALEREAARVDSQKEDKRQALESALEKARAQTRRLEEQMQTLWSDKERLAEKAQSERAAATEVQQANAVKIEQLQSQLEQNEKELERSRAESDRLAVKLAESQAPAPTVEPTQPPSIEIIDPLLRKTRGVEVVASAQATREIVGRVFAPAGLFSFLVDGQKVDVSDAGLFTATLALHEKPRVVRLTAVDRSGQSADLELELAQIRREPKKKPTSLRSGRYFALVIGNNSYEHLVDLDSASRDAKALDELLESRFGFQTTLLVDANRYQILSALNDLRQKLTEKDSLLIYYAGHGELDSAIPRGYWLPTDAERENSANWIPTTTITDIVNAISARHVMVIADSCYAGALTRSAIARIESGMSDEARQSWLEALQGKRSRTALTSGGLQPVLDAGAGAHSVFAAALLDSLRDSSSVMEGRRLFMEIAARVTKTAQRAGGDQVPEYAPIKFAGHEGGDFFFVPK